MRLGSTELLLILAIFVLLFGSTKIAGLGKAVGKSVREFKEEVKSPEEKQSEEKSIQDESQE